MTGTIRVPRPGTLLRLAVAVALLAGGLALVGRAGGVPGKLLAVENGAAWLVSSATGQAALVDGASSQVVTRVPVGNGELTSAQSGPDTYVVNNTVGSVLRVDGATFEPSDPVRFGSAARQLRVFPTAAAAFVVDDAAGLVTTADPDTLQARALQSVAARAGSGGALADSAGRLWLIDRANGDVVRLDDRGGKIRTSAGAAGSERLVLVSGQPALVDPAGRTVRPLDENGEPGAATCLETTPADKSVVVFGGQARQQVYAASGQRGTLVISDLATGRCDAVVDLAAAGHDLGEPREAAGRVFVPDFTEGRVVVVDIGQRRVVARPDVLPAGTRFELVTQGPFVFFNDPSSFRAGAIRLDGGVRVIEKYNPDKPGEGLDDGSGVAEGAGAGAGSGAGSGDSGDGDKGLQPVPATPSPSASPQVSAPENGLDVPPVTDPEVTIQVSAVRVRIGQSVTLRLAARDGTRIAGATWSFGDGTTGGGTQASHAWTQLGDYLVVADTLLADGRRAAPAVRITVDRTGTSSIPDTNGPTTGPIPENPIPSEQPIARLAVTPASGEAPLQVTADASTSTAGSAPITGYSFDFGDGTATGGPGPAATATHTYQSAQFGGTFTVTVTITDEAGRTSRASQTVTITTKGSPPPPTMKVTVAGDRWRIEAQSGTDGAPTARFGLTADLAGVTVTPLTDSAFEVIPSACTAFRVTLTAYTEDGTGTAAPAEILDPQQLDPQATQVCGGFGPPKLLVGRPHGFGFSVSVQEPVQDGSVTYTWSVTAAGGTDGYTVNQQATQVDITTTDCRVFTITVTATGPTGTALVSDPANGTGCTAPAAVTISQSVVGNQITWNWTAAGNTPVENYNVRRTYRSPSGETSEEALPSGLMTSYTTDGVPGGTYTISVEATNSAGSSTAQDTVTLPPDVVEPPPPTEQPPPPPPPTEQPPPPTEQPPPPPTEQPPPPPTEQPPPPPTEQPPPPPTEQPPPPPTEQPPPDQQPPLENPPPAETQPGTASGAAPG